MATYAENFYERVKANIGRSKGTTDWFDVTADVVDRFVDITRADTAGLLPMALLSHFNLHFAGGDAAVPAFDELEGVAAGVNYGFDGVRFGPRVEVDGRIRATSVIKDVARKGDAVDEISTITVEIEGEDEPALVADWIIRTVFEGQEQR